MPARQILVICSDAAAGDSPRPLATSIVVWGLCNRAITLAEEEPTSISNPFADVPAESLHRSATPRAGQSSC